MDHTPSGNRSVTGQLTSQNRCKAVSEMFEINKRRKGQRRDENKRKHRKVILWIKPYQSYTQCKEPESLPKWQHWQTGCLKKGQFYSVLVTKVYFECNKWQVTCISTETATLTREMGWGTSSWPKWQSLWWQAKREARNDKGTIWQCLCPKNRYSSPRSKTWKSFRKKQTSP
jgi:hypothetical protein